ncbi:Mss4-like protein [Ilyonectria sp. MPI-CAGE-AT-0026]|nr:Mss4-like protein [Ilyonectria sp. MPI-CAGE-AT-0026]
MPAPYTGKCLCGAVTFSIASEPVAVFSCFCEHCSKGAGGTHQIIAKFATKDMEISAEEEAIGEFGFTDTSSGNRKGKSFCRTCGCTLWTIPGAAKGVYHLVRTSILDEGLSLQPGSEIFVKNRPAWAKAVEGVPQFDEMRK